MVTKKTLSAIIVRKQGIIQLNVTKKKLLEWIKFPSTVDIMYKMKYLHDIKSNILRERRDDINDKHNDIAKTNYKSIPWKRL